jgi:glutathione S-transferase
MIELIQFPWSPFCLVQSRILDYSGAPFKEVLIPISDRSLVWKLTRQRYYQVPVIKDGRKVLFETDDDSQVIAKYLDDKLGLGLFPRELEGVQAVLWRYIESEIEGVGFKLNDVYWRQNVPQPDQVGYVRHKERKFGRGCLEAWREQQALLLHQLEQRLLPCEEMLMHQPFLLDERPRFVDFDLYGMLANFLWSGHYALPAELDRLADWYRRIGQVKATTFAA